ncbi:MAG TPA: hypothetical protein VKJ65_03350 [Phycisphaerae bacterium]|nr:hypothetical protein [Phycisphaerae bacterium]
MTDDQPSLDYLAEFIARRRQHWGIRLILSGLVALLGALVLPIVLISLAIFSLFYLIILVSVVFKFEVAERCILVLSGVLALLYFVFLFISFRSEWEMRWIFFSNSERRPPKEWLTGTQTGPLFYTSLGIDLLDDDVPPPLFLRITRGPAIALAKFLIQWKIYRSLRQIDYRQCAPILKKIISTGGTGKIKDLHDPDQPDSSLHDPISYLLVLDILSVNELWTSAWVSATYRDKLMPQAVDSRATPVA